MAATRLGTRALSTDGLRRKKRAGHGAPTRRVGAEEQRRAAGGPPDIEAVIGIRRVLGPLEQRPLELDGDFGDGVGRQLNQHLQEVGLQPVLGWLVVDVTWR